MIKIFVGNRYSFLQGKIPPSSLQLIKEVTSAHIPGYYFSYKWKQKLWDGKKHFFNYSTGKVPTGLLPIILNILKNMKVEYDIIPRNTFPTEAPFKPLKYQLRDYQKEAVEKILNLKRGIIHHATGSGKTFIIADILWRYRTSKCLYLTHRLELLYQTRKKMIEWGVDEKLLGIIGGGHYDLKNITFATLQTLWHMKGSEDFESLCSSTDVLLTDEVHIAPAETFYKVLMSIDAGIRIGFSGTPLVQEELRDLYVISATGPVLSVVEPSELIHEGTLSTPSIYFINMDAPKVSFLPGEGTTYNEVYDKAITFNERRNELISDMVHSCREKDLTTLVLVRRISQGEYLSKELGIPFLSGKDTAEKRQNIIEEMKSGARKAIIASTIFDEGVDIGSLQVLIVASGGKSYAKTLQRIGRTLRATKDKKATLIFDFYDSQHHYTKKHSEQRFKTYQDTFHSVSLIEPDIIERTINEYVDLNNSQ